jgi:signal transduction histidine kinase/CheY-like chemotaxis protein
VRTSQRHQSSTPILSLRIAEEADIVTARQRGRQLAVRAGFSQQDQVRLATAVSEIARNAFQYAGGGGVKFSIELNSSPQVLWVEVSDTGPGIGDLDDVLGGKYESRTGMGIGLAGSRRLMDHFQLESKPGEGTRVRFGKSIPAFAKKLESSDIVNLCAKLVQERAGALDEIQRQNQELLQTLDVLRLRELELERRQAELAHLNLELEETNRGVVALYAELDEKAVALKRADEMKSQFLRYVSHEFRTPVNSVLALSQLLLRRMDGDLTPEQEKQVQYIRRAVQELADMVNDLLDLAKVEAGKTEIRLSRIELGQFFGAIRALMRPLAMNPRVALVFDEPPPHLILESDESKLGQILRNLISNALKFTEDGEVKVSVQRTGDDSLCFSVQDTGVGIAPEHIETIFQEFSQIENPMQKRVRGTGLGLPLARKLASLLGGTLRVTSAVGSGSKFSLTLPLQPAGKSTGRQPRGNTILIIDDEETSRYITRQLFRGTKYKIIEAPTPAEGTDRARFERPALIILDLMMPHQNGFEVLNELNADEGTQDIPVVIHTSKTVTAADYERLSSRQATVLPKAGAGRREALAVIREILGEPDLFRGEPEFVQPKNEL